MPTSRALVRSASLVAVLLAACQGGANSASATDGSSGSGSTGGQPTGTGADSDTAGHGSHEVCNRYLACVAVVSPAGLPGAQMGFGDNGTCWQGSETDAQLCLEACQAGLEMYHELFPDEAKCGLCSGDSDCDTAAGETCEGGECKAPKCGDGIVQDEEICDSQPMCAADCQGPQPCNPISNYGCAENEVCNLQPAFVVGDVIAQCVPDGGATPGQAFCDLESVCEAGFGCASKQVDPSCGAPDSDGCCLRYCDLGAAKSCDAGQTCKPHKDLVNRPVVAELGFLGFCVP